MGRALHRIAGDILAVTMTAGLGYGAYHLYGESVEAQNLAYSLVTTCDSGGGGSASICTEYDPDVVQDSGEYYFYGTVVLALGTVAAFAVSVDRLTD